MESSEPYQELDEIRGSELNSAMNSARNSISSDFGLDRSLELTSVSVVPDGLSNLYFWINSKIVKYIYCYCL